MSQAAAFFVAGMLTGTAKMLNHDGIDYLSIEEVVEAGIPSFTMRFKDGVSLKVSFETTVDDTPYIKCDWCGQEIVYTHTEYYGPIWMTRSDQVLSCAMSKDERHHPEERA